jgi:hypothetical protein
MRLAKVNMALSVLVTVLFLGFNGYAQAVKRAQAANKLGNMGAKAAPAVPLLIGMLGDSAGIELKTDPEAKIVQNTSPGIEAAVALGKIGDPALDPLIAALKDKNPHFRILAAVAL